ncbi:hypothetical protein EMPS_03714 [Entomortierella parvispora]|uniref:GST N-terminal domain-containing protein n=1 Tax=Entomortierella parvispora TaxID=205924 RepID=A0A9P3LUX1_9FUNG|nr:hypothetical protein EMPS_03714 [Entomortierella parvispora]
MSTSVDAAPLAVAGTKTTADSKALTDLIQGKANVHNLVYFPFHGLVGCLRVQLILLGEPYKFTCLSFPDWMKQKRLTPFGHVPVLREETPCGQTLELAEITLIEQYLAQRSALSGSSSLLGKNFWEENQIKMFTCSTHALISFLIHSITSLPNKEADRPALFERFKKSKLPEWIAYHEKHLRANGSNGHYVGDQRINEPLSPPYFSLSLSLSLALSNNKKKLSLADIKTGTIVEHLIRLGGDTPQISQELTPGIWAVKTHLETIPAYVEWTTSTQYQQFTGANINFFGL